MRTIDPSAWMRQVRPIVGALKTPAIRSVLHEEPHPVVPFITLSREAGVGGWDFAQKLIERLNVSCPGDIPWTGWDRELVAKVAADHHVSRELVESLEERDHSWLRDFLTGLSVSSDAPSEETLFRDVSTTVRALLQVGRVVVVGMGAVFIARNLPGGVHVRLIAPHDYRVQAIAQRQGLTHDQAETEVRRLDKNREAFFARHWPARKLSPEQFHLTLNVATLAEQQLIDCIVALVPRTAPVSRPQTMAELVR